MSKEEIERAAERWEIKALTYQRANQTKLGCILIAVLGRMPENPPRVGLTGAIITEGGMVCCDMQLNPCASFKLTAIGTTKELVDELRQLCDKLKLPDVDREAMFALVRKWIVKDYRAVSDLSDWKPPKGQW